MLKELFPRAHERFSSLPLLGPIVDHFTRWLHQYGYQCGTIRVYVKTIAHLDAMLRQQGRNELSEVTREDLRVCRPANSQKNCTFSGTIYVLEQYLDDHSLLSPLYTNPPSRSDVLLSEYKHFLEDVRGLSRSTVISHLRTISNFLVHLGYESTPSKLTDLKSHEIERFIIALGKRHNRASLQHDIAHLRGFFRFAAARNRLPQGLDTSIDTPRMYRQEKLPRALPWESVCSLLASIDRRTPMGMRNYAILFLIATYGLRACEIRFLLLEDICWRQGVIQVMQPKTGRPLVLPLTDATGDVLVNYLHDGRPQSTCRHLFLRVRAPIGPLGDTGVSDVFKQCVKRSGLDIPFKGVHCLRHSYALHLLRSGTSLKTIGDLLGHQTAESTCIYLRLAIDDLREVALDVPGGAVLSHHREEQP